MCEKEFEKLTDLTSHLQSEHKVESPLFKCQFCDEKFAWKSQLKRHRATNHVIQDFEACKICKKLRCKHKGKTKGSYKKDTKKKKKKKNGTKKKKKKKKKS